MESMSIFKAAITLALPLSAVLAFGSAYAQSASVAASLGVSVYPSNGQTREQQSADESECYAWAQQSTGVDPSNPAGPAQAPPPQGDVAGQAAKGAFVGAAKGYLLAEVTDNDTGDASRAGAVIGASRGARSTAARNKTSQAQAQQQQEQQTQARMQSFKNGFSACMTGRKYTAA
jgi:hypothetical protein